MLCFSKSNRKLGLVIFLTLEEQTQLFATAINERDFRVLKKHLHPDVGTISRNNDSEIRGRMNAIQHFQYHLDSIRDAEEARFFAVPGEFEGSTDDGIDCVIAYDGAVKACIIELRQNKVGLVKKIIVDATDETLEKARPAEPPPLH